MFGAKKNISKQATHPLLAVEKHSRQLQNKKKTMGSKDGEN